MSEIFNNIKLKTVRRRLRKNQTPQEQLIWNKLRRKQLCGLRFVRQFSVDSYVLDFYCPDRKLAIELDGGHHGEDEHAEYDKVRTIFLESRNIKVLRFWNSDVYENIDDILATIARETGVEF